ncbi:MAG: HAD family phosphatase [Vicinamibacterales bacterium]
MRPAAVILDMDGLMVDTEPLYKTAWQQGTAALGYDLTDVGYAAIVGRPLPEIEQILMEMFGPAFPLERLRQRWPGLWRDEVARVGIRVKDGLPALLAFIGERGLALAVATSTKADWAAFTLERSGLAGRFPVVVTGDQIERGKPAPDIYLEAARRIGVEPARCVALEDSEAGIRSIAAAGMIGILVPHWAPSDAARAAAFRVVPTLDDALAVIAGLLSLAGD